VVESKSPLAKEAAVRVAKHASESKGHWYTQRGDQVSEVMKADGSGYTRCTLAHARKLQLAPGVTTIIGCADKPALTLWKQRQAIMAALTLPRRDSETEKEWLDRVEEDMQETSRKAAEAGSAIHAAIQSYYGRQDFEPLYTEHVEGAKRVLLATCGPQAWRAEVPVISSIGGFGTKLDLVSDEWLIDWKTTEGSQAELDEKKTWDEHAMQLAAGCQALGKRLKCAIGYVSRTHPGAARIISIEQNALDQGMQMFLGLLDYWRAKNKYRPSWCTS
jgi:hypothetical protein